MNDEMVMCEVCGKLGLINKEIVLADYYNPIFRHDSTRYECRDIERCLDRAANRFKLTIVQLQCQDCLTEKVRQELAVLRGRGI